MRHVQRVCKVSERRACRVLGQPRSSQRYEHRKPIQDGALRKRIQQLARRKKRYGRIWVLLRREGWHVNRKRVQRIWREEGLRILPRQRKRRRLGSSENSSVRQAATRKHFACIAGYTEGGAPFGLSWDEAKEMDSQDEAGPA